MPVLIVEHTVEDYGRWRAAYDAHAGARKANNIVKSQVLTDPDNANNVTVILHGAADDLDRFTQSEDLKDAMMEAGVQGRPNFTFLQAATATA